jgi:hypothetical protein
MGLLTREQIVEASKAALPRRTVTVPELGGDVIVRGMSGKDLSLFNESLFTGKGKKRKVVTVNIQAKMAVRCMEDADGNRLFTEDDAKWLGNLRADALGRIFKAIQELSGLGDDDEDDEDEDDEDDDQGK